jgi:uncharacterized metal-binding protein (TIGR02443 family)
MKPPKSNERFIAGAVCPKCAEMDRTVVSADGEVRRCIACGFSEGRPQDNLQPLPTRVSRPSARRVETAPEVVRLLDVNPTKKVED